MKKLLAIALLALCLSPLGTSAAPSCTSNASCSPYPNAPFCCSGTCQATACAPASCTSDSGCPANLPHCCQGVCHAGTCVATTQDPNDGTADGTVNSGNEGFGFGQSSILEKVAGPFKSSTPQTLEQKISSIISIFLSFLGVIFLILMIYAGFNWMTAAGDEERITKSKETIRAAVIGLVIVLAAYALSVFVISQIWGATNGNNTAL